MPIVDRIHEYLQDQQWHTGLMIAWAAGKAGYTTGVAAKLRQLRDPDHGRHTIESRLCPEALRGAQVWEYRLQVDGGTTCPSCSKLRSSSASASVSPQPSPCGSGTTGSDSCARTNVSAASAGA